MWFDSLVIFYFSPYVVVFSIVLYNELSINIDVQYNDTTYSYRNIAGLMLLLVVLLFQANTAIYRQNLPSNL